MDEVLKYAMENGIEVNVQFENEVIKLSILHKDKHGKPRVAKTTNIYRDEYDSLEKCYYYVVDALETLIDEEKKYKNSYNGTNSPTLNEILNSMGVSPECDRM